MPQITKLVPVDGGLGVVLDVPPSNDGSVAIFTASELEALKERVRRDTREDCAEVAEKFGDVEIRDAILALSKP